MTRVLLFLLLLCVLSVKPHKFLGEEPQRFILFYCRVLGGGEETDPCFSFMLKEIEEQPEIINNILEIYEIRFFFK